ncbi:MAG TPA: methyltransferase domain-containing protein [Mycobacteriales bacterium]|nr:methyltransferase domain-containing protein [Mycobacteriales bacterium]
MTADRDLARPTVSPDEYDEDYYRTACAGHDEWVSSAGAGQAGLYKGILKRCGISAGMTVCDIGAGRGELVALAAEHGARWAIGVEYSPAAAGMAAQSMAQREVASRATVVLADARRLPLPDGCVDLVFMIDVIEHLSPAELAATFAEAHRVLRPGGRLFAHTFPTRTIYDVTYRGMRAVAGLRGHHWPADPRNDYEHRMHVNEQTRSGLRRSLRTAGFRSPDVRFGQWVHTDFVPSPRGKDLYHRLARHRLTAPLAVADLWVDAARA